MIRRDLETALRERASKFPVVTVTGPRQSGKTTLCRATSPEKAYVTLEPPDTRRFAAEDPRGFLAGIPDGAVIDEVQRVPDLLSYIQAEVDRDSRRGRFILTGSANLSLLDSVSQSLAGRTSLLTLLPLTLQEVRRFEEHPTTLDDTLWRGSAPAIYDRELSPTEWYASYVATYVERDVRSLLRINDLVTFQRFVGLAAGRAGQLLNLSSLGADAGIRHATAGAWLSVMEASYLSWRLPPLTANVTSRLVKTPKLHFFDTGLVCYLLGMRSPDHLRNHPLRPFIFETWVASELAKAHYHAGDTPVFSFFRDARGREVDIVEDLGAGFLATEAKSGATVPADAFDGLRAFDAVVEAAWPGRPVDRRVVYGGDDRQSRSHAEIVPWSQLAD